MHRQDEYDPEWDSPEARANFATRHIFSPLERKRKRNEKEKKNISEGINENKITILLESDAETLVCNSSDPERMRASLFSLFVCDFLVYQLYPSHCDDYHSEFAKKIFGDARFDRKYYQAYVAAF